MEIYEDFIKDLLKSNIIEEHASSISKTEEFYNNHYKHKTQCSFVNFADDLWRFWYMSHSTKNRFHFDKMWIDYLKKKMADSIQQQQKNKESKCIDKKGCILCDVTFNTHDEYEEHKKRFVHQIRMQYVVDKNVLSKSNDLILKVIEVNNKCIVDQNLKIQLESKTNVNITMQLQNASKNQILVSQIIQINERLPNFTMHGKYEEDSWMEPDEIIGIALNGCFENSMDFLFPIVIVTGSDAANNRRNILKEIPIEVISEFSSLKPQTIFTKKSKLKLIHHSDDAIIPGKGTEPPLSFYKETLPLKPFGIKPLLQQKINDLVKLYPTFIERDAGGRFQNMEYARFLQIDPVLRENNYCSLMENYLDIEENQMKIDIRDYDTVSTLKVVQGTSLYDLSVPGLAEARPSLLVSDSVYLKLNRDDQNKYQGIVHRVLQQSVHLGFNYRFSGTFTKKKKYFIEFGFNRRPIRVQKQAVSLVKQHNIVPYFYPKQLIEMDNDNHLECLTYFNPLLNEEQKRAVVNILDPKLTVPYIIFGPPGTGKTVTVVEAILQIWKIKPSSRILVCAPSNAATNEVALRLVDKMPNTDIFRLVGNVYGHEHKLSNLEDIVNIKQDGTFYIPSMEDLLKCRVLLVTTVTAARIVNGGVPVGHFSHVFIDESGYASEPESLIPIAGILSDVTSAGRVLGQVVLAGDPRQLGPVVHSAFAKYCGYGKSMLERLLDTCDLYTRNGEYPNSYNEKFVTKLLKNYRSHKTILKVPNELFYDNELIATGNIYTDIFVDWKYLKTPKFPMIFHHVEGEEVQEESSPSFFNIQEIEEVAGYLSKLTESYVKGINLTQNHIGVITPYRKQAEMLRSTLQKKYRSILVGSVEQFQGKEKLVIIISTVRSKNSAKFEDIDRKCHLGFVKNPKRFNVALTRAKALLIVIGNALVLKDDKNWLSFIEYCHANNSVAGKSFKLDDNRNS